MFAADVVISSNDTMMVLGCCSVNWCLLGWVISNGVRSERFHIVHFFLDVSV